MAYMNHEIDLGGTIYISSRRAAEITGYKQDYVGQLARSGAIVAQRVSGLWYVLEASIKAHKENADSYVPEPPRRDVQNAESTVSFDGKEMISAHRAAKLSGYNADYVGQLARNGKISARQVGNRWYVDRDEILDHKRYNDSLLAAVQTESVGLQRPEIPETKEIPHFTYIKEEVVETVIPSENESRSEDEDSKEPNSEAEVDENPVDEVPEVMETRIPIKVYREAPIVRKKSSIMPMKYVYTLVGSVIVIVLFVAAYNFTPTMPTISISTLVPKLESRLLSDTATELNRMVTKDILFMRK